MILIIKVTDTVELKPHCADKHDRHDKGLSRHQKNERTCVERLSHKGFVRCVLDV